MSKRKSRGKESRGIYLRGNIYWYQRMVNGRRVQCSLGTTDFGEAVVKAVEIRAEPFLVTPDPLQPEIDAFIEYKIQQNEYSRDSAESKRYALREFASFVNKADPSTILAADVDRFYQMLRKRVKESTAQGYITTLRSFSTDLSKGGRCGRTWSKP